MMLDSLEHYTFAANRFIVKWASKRRWKIKDHNELIADLIRIMVRSDQTWNQEKSGGRNKQAYRTLNMLRFMTKYMKREIKIRSLNLFHSDIPLDDIIGVNEGCFESMWSVEDQPMIHEDRKRLIGYLRNNANLTYLQKEHIDAYLQGFSMREIADKYGTTKVNVAQILKESIKKMKTLTGEKNEVY